MFRSETGVMVGEQDMWAVPGQFFEYRSPATMFGMKLFLLPIEVHQSHPSFMIGIKGTLGIGVIGKEYISPHLGPMHVDGGPAALERLALRDRGNAQAFAILGHRATCNDDALLTEQFGNTVVR